MDLQSREKWVEFSKAKDELFKHTDIKQAPWYTVEADDKRRARLNCISHLLDLIPYKDVDRKKVKLPKRSKKGEYDDQATLQDRRYVPEKF